MVCDVELADAEREVDRIEIFERNGEIRKVKREKNEGEECQARLKGSPSSSVRRRPSGRSVLVERGAFSRAIPRHAGRMNSPSFRLPIR